MEFYSFYCEYLTANLHSPHYEGTSYFSNLSLVVEFWSRIQCVGARKSNRSFYSQGEND